AARRIWARWLRDRYGATDPAAQRLRFHTQTAGVSLTAQQPMNNVARTAVEALAAVLGGTQSLHTNALDEVLALPTEQAATLELLEIPMATEHAQRGAIERTRTDRDAAVAGAALASLVDAARQPEADLMMPLIDCARARCTEGEVTEALQSVFGPWRETPVF